MPHLTPVHLKTQQHGLNLIEVMIAVFVLSIGLLGMASIQLTGLQANQSAYFRTQASILAYDIADRMRSNSASALAGDYVADGNSFSTAAPPPQPPCSAFDPIAGAQVATGCTPQQQANADRFEWSNRVRFGNNNSNLLPSAEGIVSRVGNVFTVNITWQETNPNETNDPNAGTPSTPVAENRVFNLVFAL